MQLVQYIEGMSGFDRKVPLRNLPPLLTRSERGGSMTGPHNPSRIRAIVTRVGEGVRGGGMK
jgi:hypothetical protein